MNVRYTPAARSDLCAVRRYIETELANPTAAIRISSLILSRCASLARHPLIGTALQAHVARETDIRYLTCENHLVFYRVETDFVSILRVLHSRQDWLRHLGL